METVETVETAEAEETEETENLKKYDSLTYSLTDNLKARDASASKNRRNGTGWLPLDAIPWVRCASGNV